MEREICIYVEIDSSIGEFFDGSGHRKDSLRSQGLTDLCPRCKFMQECKIFKTTQYRYFSTKNKTKYTIK